MCCKSHYIGFISLSFPTMIDWPFIVIIYFKTCHNTPVDPLFFVFFFAVFRLSIIFRIFRWHYHNYVTLWHIISWILLRNIPGHLRNLEMAESGVIVYACLLCFIINGNIRTSVIQEWENWIIFRGMVILDLVRWNLKMLSAQILLMK